MRQADSFGRLASVIEPSASSATYTYDVLGNLTGLAQVGSGLIQSRAFAYDSISRLIAASNPESGQNQTCASVTGSQWSTCYSYDAYGNLRAKSDARGVVTAYEYDALNRMIHKTYSTGDRNQWFAYDGKDENGNSLGFPWTSNALGRLYHTSDSVAVASTYAYDVMGRLSIKNDCVPSNCSPGVFQLAGYDLASNLVSLTYPSGRQLAIGYDGAGSPVSINGAGNTAGAVYLQSAMYHADGTPASIAYGNGVSETASQNSRLQTCESVVAKGAQTFLDRQYFYGTNNTSGQQCNPIAGNNGNIWGIVDAVDGTHTQSFSYDALNRLTTWNAPNLESSYRQLSFTYDSFGNMVSNRGFDPGPGPSLTAVGTPSARAFPNASYDISQWPYNSANQRVSATFDCTPANGSTPYDAAGNILCDGSSSSLTAKQYIWDGESRISSVNAQPGSGNTYYPAAAYTYDAQGQRIRSDLYSPNNTSNGWREYTYFNGMMLADQDQNGTWTDYIYANGKKIARATMPNGSMSSSGPTTTTVTGLHLHGSEAAAGTPVGASWLLDLGSIDTPDVNLENHTVQSGDQIAWRQFQSASMTGGFGLYFWDCGGTGQLLDTNGVDVYASPVHNAWETRALSLEPYVGCRFQTFAVKSWTIITPGPWDFWMTDVVLRHADGTSLPVYTQSNAPAPTFQGADSGETSDSANLDTMTITSGAGAGTATNSGSTLAYTITDHLGTADLEFSDTGALTWEGSFAPFGQEVDSNQTTNRYKFTGKERDTESGLDYFRARYYASNMGRWMSPDPRGNSVADLTNPQSWNLYAYVLNNPLKYVDPTGLDCAYLNAAGTDIESGGLDQNSNSGECKQNGGLWVDGAINNVTYNAKNDVIKFSAYDQNMNSSDTSFKGSTNITPFNADAFFGNYAAMYRQNVLAQLGAIPTPQQYIQATAQTVNQQINSLPKICAVGIAGYAGVGGHAGLGLSADTQNGVQFAGGAATSQGSSVSFGGSNGNVNYAVPIPDTPLQAYVGTQNGNLLNDIRSVGVSVGKKGSPLSAAAYADLGTQGGGCPQ